MRTPNHLLLSLFPPFTQPIPHPWKCCSSKWGNDNFYKTKKPVDDRNLRLDRDKDKMMKISPVNERNLCQHLRYQLLLLLLRQIGLHQHGINIISNISISILLMVISRVHKITINCVVAGTIFAIIMLASQIGVTALAESIHLVLIMVMSQI